MIMMAFNRLEDVPEMKFAEEDELIKCYAGRTDEPFGISVTLRSMRRSFDDAD